MMKPNELINDWLDKSKKLRWMAGQTKDRMTEQGFLAEAYCLEVCADQLKRAITTQSADPPDADGRCPECKRKTAIKKPIEDLSHTINFDDYWNDPPDDPASATYCNGCGYNHIPGSKCPDDSEKRR